MKRFFMVAISVICVLGIVGGVAYYIVDRMNYITTDNARLEADTVTIAPSSTGQLTDWSARVGSRIQQGDILGVETGASSAAKGQQGTSGAAQSAGERQEIISPMTGTVLGVNAAAKQVVQQGQPLAVIADMSSPYITAYIDEDKLRDIAVNKNVDVYLDAYPGTKFKGKVAQIGGSAGTFLSGQSALQQGNGKQSKEVERVPVKVTVNDFYGKYVALGMNATIKIHK